MSVGRPGRDRDLARQPPASRSGETPAAPLPAPGISPPAEQPSARPRPRKPAQRFEGLHGMRFAGFPRALPE